MPRGHLVNPGTKIVRSRRHDVRGSTRSDWHGRHDGSAQTSRRLFLGKPMPDFVLPDEQLEPAINQG